MTLSASSARATPWVDPVSGHAGEVQAGVRVVIRDRPTGKYLGHYLGTLANRVRLQELGANVTVVIEDYQVITDRGPGPVRDRVRNLVAEYLAAGIDPNCSVIFPHSAVPALNQLMLPFLSLVSDAELRRNPTVKAESLASRRPLSALLLTYPVHQAADILGLQADVVPAGRDQLPHLEFARVVARRFGSRYAPVFEEPRALLSQTPVVLGWDGAKMSKTRGNAILLGDSEDASAAEIRSAQTGGHRHIAYAPQTRPRVANLLSITAAMAGTSPQPVAQDVGDAGAAVTAAGRVNQVRSALRMSYLGDHGRCGTFMSATSNSGARNVSWRDRTAGPSPAIAIVPVLGFVGPLQTDPPGCGRIAALDDGHLTGSYQSGPRPAWGA